MTYPCRACKAKIMRNQADVKLGAAKAASAQATSDPSSGGSPPSKRTRSKGPEPTIPDGKQASKPKNLVNYSSTTSSSDSVMSVSIEEASPPPVVTISDSTSVLSSSEPTTSAGDPSSESSGVESADEAEGERPESESARRSSAEAEFNVNDNHA